MVEAALLEKYWLFADGAVVEDLSSVRQYAPRKVRACWKFGCRSVCKGAESFLCGQEAEKTSLKGEMEAIR